MAEGNGKNGNPVSTGTPAVPPNGGNGKTTVAALIEDSKVVAARAAEELKAMKDIQKTDVFKSVLTPEQFSKFEEMFRRRGFGRDGHEGPKHATI